jgi:hypothetical protein
MQCYGQAVLSIFTLYAEQLFFVCQDWEKCFFASKYKTFHRLKMTVLFLKMTVFLFFICWCNVEIILFILFLIVPQTVFFCMQDLK